MPTYNDRQLAFLSAFRQRTDLALADNFNDSDIDNLEEDASAVAASYHDWSPDTTSEGTHGASHLDVFAPRVFDALEFNRLGSRHHQADLMRREWDVEKWKRQVLHLCLYTDSLWLPDPVELIAGSIGSWAQARWSLMVHETLMTRPYIAADIAEALTGDLAPLVDAGAIKLYPAITRFRRGVSMALFGVARSFTDEELTTGWPDTYVAEGLLYAQEFDASYVALDNAEFGALQAAMRDVAQIAGVADQRILATLPRMKLPYFERLNAKTLVSVRASDASFNDFRSLLRETSRQLVAGVDDPQFDVEVARLEKDSLTPALSKLVSDVKGTTTLRERLADARIDFMAGALGGFVLKGDLAAAVVAGAATSLAKALMKTVFTSKSARPAARVVYQFHTGRPFGFMTLR
jgi:hypothetical protein